MSQSTKKGWYSLRWRIQLLAAVSTLFIAFVATAGTWIITHTSVHDPQREATDRVIGAVLVLSNPHSSEEMTRDATSQLKVMMRRNPDAWYYVSAFDSVYSSAPGDPRFMDQIVGQNVALSSGADDSLRCNVLPVRIWAGDDAGSGIVQMGGCGVTAYYLEVQGIRTDLPFWNHIWDIVKLTLLEGDMATVRAVPLVLLTVLMLGAFGLLFGSLMNRVREVSKAASQIGVDGHHILLPENNLPIEIAPMVQAINRAIGRLESASEQQAMFVAAAAHELRTPLAVHRSKIEELDDSELKEKLALDVQQMGSMITQLLTLARVGTLEDQFTELRLANVVEDICVERGRAVLQAGKKLTFESTDNNTLVFGERESIKSVIANLIDNALSFTPKGKTIHVRVDGNRATVRDEGPGVAQGDKDQIFEPFFKNPPNKRGHGLGLAIVAAIMRIHKGSVSNHNEPKGGAVFKVEFPGDALDP